MTTDTDHAECNDLQDRVAQVRRLRHVWLDAASVAMATGDESAYDAAYDAYETAALVLVRGRQTQEGHLMTTDDPHDACIDLQDRVARIRQLHRQIPSDTPLCTVCRDLHGYLVLWPCPTVMILDATQ